MNDIRLHLLYIEIVLNCVPFNLDIYDGEFVKKLRIIKKDICQYIIIFILIKESFEIL